MVHRYAIYVDGKLHDITPDKQQMYRITRLLSRVGTPASSVLILSENQEIPHEHHPHPSH